MTDDPKHSTPEAEPNGSVQFLRPLGYVEPVPIIRRVRNRELYLGNQHAADPTAHDRSFSVVLTVSSDEQPLTTHHRPLTDGPGNDWRAFTDAVDTARRLQRHEGSLLIHCKAGISRSSTVLATALAANEGCAFDDALTRVQLARPAAVPHPKLHELAVTYLAARSE
ncbi:Dual specificity phosphatase, catalytic domain [Halogranum rubrum]|uniref:Dual specificity phosphatase, catalytic domain n=1 Tax=Halogranum rubrum TaxID=553466 RepID=A0A1I4CET1_9EURY|nr:dual specificity protein phosphatase [Halogranum rubrum]SFK79090.1 Dual specificity phosphatase, catalytic domain [Halogranum rubrum]